MQELVTETDCRLVYLDILNGYTVSGEHVVKHSTEFDYCLTERVRQKFLIDGAKLGLVSEKEKLILLSEHGVWTNQEENGYLAAKDELDSLLLSAKNLYIPQQIEDMKRRITEARHRLQEDFGQRAVLIGTTKEVFAMRRASEAHILRSFYKDPDFKHPEFTQEDADAIEPAELHIFMDIYESVAETYVERNMKRICVCPFFLSSFYVCKDSVFNFFGKAVVQLSLYQVSLFNKGKFYKNIFEEPDIVRCPEEYYSDLSKVIKHYDQQYSILLGKRRAGN